MTVEAIIITLLVVGAAAILLAAVFQLRRREPHESQEEDLQLMRDPQDHPQALQGGWVDDGTDSPESDRLAKEEERKIQRNLRKRA